MPESTVVAAARDWVQGLRADHPEVVRVGYFGSYARGDYVPGSDFDVLMELSASPIDRWQDRAETYVPSRFPIGMNLFAYTTSEMARQRAASDAFLAEIERTVRWLEI